MGIPITSILAGFSDAAYDDTLERGKREAQARKNLFDIYSAMIPQLPMDMQGEASQSLMEFISNPRMKTKQFSQRIHDVFTKPRQAKEGQARLQPAQVTMPTAPEQPPIAQEPQPLPPPPMISPLEAGMRERRQMATEQTREEYGARYGAASEAEERERQQRVRALVASGMSEREATQQIYGTRQPVEPLQQKNFINKKTGDAITLIFNSRRGTYTDPANPDQPVDMSQYEPVTSRTSLAWQFVRARMAEGMTLIDAVRDYNTRYTSSTGVQFVPQPDGSLLPVEVTRTGVSTRGTPSAIPKPPSETKAPTPRQPTTGTSGTLGGRVRVGTEAVGARVPANIQAQVKRAKDLLEEIPHIRSLVTNLSRKGMLGPAMGRWNEFMTGRVGTGPEFARLRTALKLFQTGLMVPHVGLRGGVVLLQEFKGQWDAGKMDGPTLLAALDEGERILRRYAEYPTEQRKRSVLPRYDLQGNRID